MYLVCSLTAALFLAAPSLAVSSDVPQIDEISLLDVLAHTDRFSEDALTSSGCQCQDKSCGCCMEMDHHKACVDVSYLASPSHGILVIFTMDGKVYYNFTVTAENPPPFCFGIPTLKRLGQVCIKLTNFAIHGYSVQGCVELEIKISPFFVKDYKLGCFKFPREEMENRRKPLYDYLFLRGELKSEPKGSAYRMENVLRFVRQMK